MSIPAPSAAPPGPLPTPPSMQGTAGTPPAPLDGVPAEQEGRDGGSVEKYKTKLCVFHNSVRGCPYGDKCLFAHGQHELRPDTSGRKAPSSSVSDNPLFKTKLCKHWTTSGHKFCPHSTRCVFAHGEAELRVIGSAGEGKGAGAVQQRHPPGGDADRSRALRGRHALPPASLPMPSSGPIPYPMHPGAIMAQGGPASAMAGMPPGTSPIMGGPGGMMPFWGMSPMVDPSGQHSPQGMFGMTPAQAAQALSMMHQAAAASGHPGHYGMPWTPPPAHQPPPPAMSPIAPQEGGDGRQAAALRFLSEAGTLPMQAVVHKLVGIRDGDPPLYNAVVSAARKLGQPLPDLSYIAPAPETPSTPSTGTEGSGTGSLPEPTADPTPSFAGLGGSWGGGGLGSGLFEAQPASDAMWGGGLGPLGGSGGFPGIGLGVPDQLPPPSALGATASAGEDSTDFSTWFADVHSEVGGE